MTAITSEGSELSPALHGHRPEEHFECLSQIETEPKSVLWEKLIINV